MYGCPYGCVCQRIEGYVRGSIAYVRVPGTGSCTSVRRSRVSQSIDQPTTAHNPWHLMPCLLAAGEELLSLVKVKIECRQKQAT